MKAQTLSFLTSMALLISFISCTDDVQELETEQLQLLKQIVMTTEDFEAEAGSRTLYQIAEGAVKCSWASNDTVGVFPDKGMQTCFPMTSENGMKDATFDGGGWALKDGSTYGAYYPFIGNMYLDRKSIPVSYKEQIQVGNSSIAHLGTYDYMVATPAAPEFGSVHFTFKHLGVLVQLRLTIPQAATLTSMKLVTEIKAFALEGKVNIMADAPSISPIISDNEIELILQNISTTEENQVVTLYMMLPPTDLSEQTLKAVVVSNKGTLEYVLGNKDFQAGKAYALTGTIKEQPVGNGTYQNGVVSIAEAGTMINLLGSDFRNITTLKVIGPINGDDVYFLRMMLGGSDFTETNRGKLATLDLSEATIIEGGDANYEKYYTLNNIIGEAMFSECANLQNIILPNSAIAINDNAFEECKSLVTVTIGNGIKSIGNRAFIHCDALSSIILGNALTSIGEGTFYGCSSLTSITISNAVSSIGESAFSYTSLASIIIPNNVTSIGKRAFSYNVELKSATIGDGLTIIDEELFTGCSNLESISIGKNVHSIKEHAFSGCYQLTSVHIFDISAWCEIDFTPYEWGRSYDCESNPLWHGAKLYLEEEELTELVIPENITKIKDCTFYGCGSLKKVNIHENVTSIGKNAFYSCSNLAIVSLGKNVKDIGKYAFNACTSITECYCYATTPPSYFGSMIGNQSTLYVPMKCSVLYSESDFGVCFDNIVEMY